MEKLTLDQASELTTKVNITYIRERKNGIRLGQTYMNELHSISPELYNHITKEGVCDPFYNDKHIEAFLEFIVED